MNITRSDYYYHQKNPVNSYEIANKELDIKNEYSPGQDLDCPYGQSPLFESGVSFFCDALHIQM